jgi:Tol biopolymer transport system component
MTQGNTGFLHGVRSSDNQEEILSGQSLKVVKEKEQMRHRYVMFVTCILAVGMAVMMGRLLNYAWAQSIGATTRISVDLYGNEANGSSEFPAISADSRFVAFDSSAANLVIGDTNDHQDVFVHDRATGGITRASVVSDSTQANGSSSAPAISASGRFVAFHSYADNLVTGDTNGSVDVFVQDGLTGDVARVSVASDGTEGLHGGALYPAISADGRFVAFYSCADTLVISDTNDDCDIFVRDRDTDDDDVFDEPGHVSTVRVSVASDGTEANGDSYFATMSADGRFVAFESYADNLVAGDANGKYDVFLHDRDADGDGMFDESGEVSTVRISVASDGTEGNDHSGCAAISADGRYVAFKSDADNLVPSDTNEYTDIFLRDWKYGVTTRISVSSSGTAAHWHSDAPSISFNGRYVAFMSQAYDLDPICNYAAWHVFVRDWLTGQTTCVSLASVGTQPDGNGGSLNPSVSADGRFVAFGSDADNLVPGDSNESRDIFLRDREAAGSVGVTIPTSGGTLVASGIVMDFPANTFTDTVVVTHTAYLPGEAPSPGGNLIGIDQFFDIDAIYASTGQPAQPAPGQIYTVTISYSEGEKGAAIEGTLALYYWNGSQWVPEASSVYTASNTVVAAPNHLSLWAVLGETRRVYLPLVLKND